VYGIFHGVHADGLLNQARANYRDNTPRHAYADYLLENGDAYGEFVALSLETPRPGVFGHGCLDDLSAKAADYGYQYSKPGQRHLELYRTHAGNWLGPGWIHPEFHRFERGLLVAGVHYPDTTPEEFGTRWADRLPIVAGVRLRVTFIKKVATLHAWFTAGFGLVEIQAPTIHSLRPERIAEALVTAEDVGVTTLVRIVAPSRAGRYPGQPVESEWYNRFAPILWAHPDSPVRRRCQVETILSDGPVVIRSSAERETAPIRRRKARS
jgi:uncharacterized protein (TIGR02996 family)